MKTFKEYYEEKEAAETLEEGFGTTVTTILGKLLGIGTAGVLSAWLAALLFKGGSKAVSSFAETLGQNKEMFKKHFKQEAKESQAVKKEINEMEILRKKYEEEFSEIVKNIREKKFNEAAEEFHSLPRDKQVSVEVKKFMVEEIIKATQQLPSANPTPGNETYRIIKKFTDLATAKAIAQAIQEQARKYIVEGK